MAFSRRSYAGAAVKTTLVNPIGAGDASLVLASATGWPTGSGGNFVMLIDQGLNTEEKILCSALSGTTATLGVRGYDGTAASAHAAGATILHSISAVDMDEANNTASQTLGLVSAKGDLLVGSAANTLAKIPIGASGTVATVAGGTLSWAQPKGLLAVTAYNPGTAANYTTPGSTDSSSIAALDSTNLTATFTAPSTGNVVVRFQGLAYNNAATTGAIIWWGVILDGAYQAATMAQVYGTGGAAGNATSITRCTHTCYLTGLSAGSHTIQWGWAGTPSTVTVTVGGSGATRTGPGVIEVWA